jgi:hypothetical protein
LSSGGNGVAVADGARWDLHDLPRAPPAPGVVNTVRRNEQIIQCDHCNRILYFTPVAPAPADNLTQPT